MKRTRAIRRRHAGGPPDLNARRRATTVEGRRALPDTGTRQLAWRKARVAGSSAAPVELTDSIGILAIRGLIAPSKLRVARLLASWLRSLARSWGLSQGSSDGLWQALVSGSRDSGTRLVADTGHTLGDHAARRLGELYRHFTALGQIDGLALAVRVVSGESWPANTHALHQLRNVLQAIANMLERGRPRPPSHLATAPG